MAALRRWTPEDDALIHDGAGRRLADVAADLGRCVSEVSTRSRTLGYGPWRRRGGNRPLVDGYLVREWLDQGGRRRIPVLEHRAVMADLLGRPLRSDEVVHHINGDKLDNDPSNLWLCTPATHRAARMSVEGLLPELLKHGVIFFDREAGAYRAA